MPKQGDGKSEKVMIGVLILFALCVLFVMCIPISMLIRNRIGSDNDDERFSDLFLSWTFWITFVVMVLIMILSGVVHNKVLRHS
jgi:uncharacterized BrkB/YihY/UPF0761 family membrane protein